MFDGLTGPSKWAGKGGGFGHGGTAGMGCVRAAGTRIGKQKVSVSPGRSCRPPHTGTHADLTIERRARQAGKKQPERRAGG